MQYYVKGDYYENNTFPGIWGVVLGLWCSHTHTNFEKSPVGGARRRAPGVRKRQQLLLLHAVVHSDS